ncbi:MAG: PEP-CTERM sorting domain-containing protein [Verrucomicrobiota bacterium]
MKKSRRIHTLAKTILIIGMLSGQAYSAILTFENSSRITVNDGGFASSDIVVTGITGTVTKVTFEFDVFNSGVFADYDFKLRAPNLQEVLVISDIDRFGSFGGGITFTVDDDFPEFPSQLIGNIEPSYTGRVTDHPGLAIGDSDPPITGGPGDLGKFNSIDPNGTWRFIIIDDTDQIALDPIGQFENVKINFTVVPEPSSSLFLGLISVWITFRRSRR